MSSDVMDALMPLIPVIGGALIGVLGGLVGTNYAHKLNNAQTKTSEKKEKLESLVTELYEIDVWLKKEESYFLYGGAEHLEQSPISRINALVELYFPELRDETSLLTIQFIEYRKWLSTGAQLRLKAGLHVPPREHMDKVLDFYAPLTLARDEVIKKAAKISIILNRK